MPVRARHLSRASARLGALVAALALLLAGIGAASLAAGSSHPAAPRPQAAMVRPLGVIEPAVASRAAAPRVAPLRTRITPDVLVLARHPLTHREVVRIAALAQATAYLTFDAAQVHLGGGTTDAIGVNPSTFRSYTPVGTADSNPLWQSVARGDAAVAHSVARALGVPLGGTTMVGARRESPIRVGAYATTGLPGVGVVVDRDQDTLLGLVRNTGLILTAPGSDPVVTAAVLHQALGSGYTVTSLRVPVSNGRLEWVAPAFGPITSPFGWRQDPMAPGHRSFHTGIDIGAPFGSPIYAAADGYVQYAGPATGFGQEIVLTHADGVTTVYGHMETILVTSGPVTAGQPIALVGAEGDATGPHLHFEVHVNDQLVDPLVWLRAHGVQIDGIGG